MKKMKIVLIGSGVVSIPPKKGGAVELIIYELSKFLAQNKQDVLVFDMKERNNKKAESIEGARYERLSVPRFSSVFLLRLSEFLFGLKSLFKARESHADIIHCQTVFSALPFALLKWLVPGKLVYTSHNPAWSEDKNDVLNELVLKIEGFLARKFDSVSTVSHAMKKGIIKRTGIKNISIIYNFVDTKRFSPKGKTWKKRMNISGPIVLFVSKLTKNKGVEYFIRSAKLVREKMPNAKFVLVGPTSFEYEAGNPWQELVDNLGLKGTVLFAGAASPQELPFVYSSADVFCFPTLKEAFGIVIIEALACGAPVVSSKIPVVEEVVADAALLVPPRDAKAVAEAVMKILSDKRLAASLRKKALKRKDAFEKENVLKDYLKLYEQVDK